MARWPAETSGRLPDGGAVVLRPLRLRDRNAWLEVRRANHDWLVEWEPTAPIPGTKLAKFGAYVRQQNRSARLGLSVPFVIEVDGELAGAITLSSVIYGALRGCSVGYWVARSHIGRGVAPLAVALACDHGVAVLGLHRFEVNIRPDNPRSLAVARKLAFRDEGVRRDFLHINGAWRDHRTFALTTDDLAGQTFTQRLSDVAQGRRTSA